MAAVASRPAPMAYESPKWGFAGNMKIEDNSGALIDPDVLGWLEPLASDASDEELRTRYEQDGVVWVKGVIPREKVLAMRRTYFEYVASSGVLKEGSDPTDGIFCGGDPHKFAGPGVASHLGVTEAECDFLAKSVSAHQEDFVKTFAQDGHIMNMVKRIKPDWEDPLLFKRQLLRSNVPNSEGTATKVHFDQIFLRAAPPTSLTAWVPIGDVPPESGGLIYLENSVPLGNAIEEEFTRINATLSDEQRMSAFNVNMVERGTLSKDCGKFAREQDGEKRRWLIADYEAGDVVFHHPCMIHASGVNRDPLGRIRLATDLRFADRAAPYDYRWANQYFKPGDGL
ncbi:uncharacterized protein I303_105870 [Kwoniella dejecticola CBS 10117]|uniref:Phytanoyl-CoA dioxygenase n=1 Tax=Kwoniella dejecticola CBS 10117 TaxID=1296121 RepID=A0A1A6A0P1_9TREE|nr:uncharacterized protein I303_05891 [Kwoniella dejecticola CBS 10117]OBR83611.1 hypothetical protein I303_05891 [Kwoniella dejecticola CBS 10117]